MAVYEKSCIQDFTKTLNVSVNNSVSICTINVIIVLNPSLSGNIQQRYFYVLCYVFSADQTEELRYKYVIVELFGADCLPLFTTILQVCGNVLLVSVDSTQAVRSVAVAARWFNGYGVRLPIERSRLRL